MKYKFTRFVINLILRLVAHIDIFGLENIPSSGSSILATNHLGRLDPLLAYYILNRQDIIMFVAEKYRQIPVFRWFVKQLDAIFIERFNADFHAMRVALNRLRQGGVLVIAPEGTRSPTGALIEGRSGVSYLAAKTGVPIVPVALTGSEDKVVIAQLRRLRRVHITVRVGKPFVLSPIDDQDRDEVLQRYTEEIMCKIAALLPPSYRGVYADHTRLKELIEANG
jgi:1-acyl-sn-glycerol-3-phosphate acyltransferase